MYSELRRNADITVQASEITPERSVPIAPSSIPAQMVTGVSGNTNTPIPHTISDRSSNVTGVYLPVTKRPCKDLL